MNLLRRIIVSFFKNGLKLVVLLFVLFAWPILSQVDNDIAA